jgi:light-regulated signal transduction histidine kinase (bacteriophytochrome)
MLSTAEQREEFESRLAASARQLGIAHKELEDLSYSVSHDLRAPLRAIEGFSKILVEDYRGALDAEGQRFVELIVSSGRQMSRMLDGLLELSRLARQPLERSTLNMRQMVQSAVDDFPLDKSKRCIEFKLQPLPEAFGDYMLIRQVWVNLIDNAVKFTGPREKAVIEIGGNKEPEGTTYFVKDNGVGFASKSAAKLFGAFQRFHGVSEFEGLGMGLAEVQRIVSRHTGEVWAESMPNEGATFYFRLPTA